MSGNSPFHDSQKLVRCEVLNRYQETSTRFVEIDAFKLWEYLMINKHGLKVGRPTPCLWIDGEEYQRSANVFERSGDVEPVNRIVVDLFDDEYGFSQTTVRYVREAETGQVVEILKSHIHARLCDTDACQIDIIPGQVVQQRRLNARRGVMMGLEG